MSGLGSKTDQNMFPAIRIREGMYLMDLVSFTMLQNLELKMVTVHHHKIPCVFERTRTLK